MTPTLTESDALTCPHCDAERVLHVERGAYLCAGCRRFSVHPIGSDELVPGFWHEDGRLVPSFPGCGA